MSFVGHAGRRKKSVHAGQNSTRNPSKNSARNAARLNSIAITDVNNRPIFPGRHFWGIDDNGKNVRPLRGMRNEVRGLGSL